jgi:hypothetical protein
MTAMEVVTAAGDLLEADAPALVEPQEGKEERR